MENEIEIKDTLNLSDGNEYVVCSKVFYEGKSYLYLIDIDNYKNVKFCEEVREENDHKVVDITSAELIKILLPLFYEAGKDAIGDLLDE